MMDFIGKDWEGFFKKCQRISLSEAYHESLIDILLEYEILVYFLRYKGCCGEILWISPSRHQMFSYNVVVLMETNAVIEVVLSASYYVYADVSEFR